MSQFLVTVKGTSWLKAEVVIEALNAADAEQKAKDKFNELDWEIVEIDPPVIVEARAVEKATDICSFQLNQDARGALAAWAMSEPQFFTADLAHAMTGLPIEVKDDTARLVWEGRIRNSRNHASGNDNQSGALATQEVLDQLEGMKCPS